MLLVVVTKCALSNDIFLRVRCVLSFCICNLIYTGEMTSATTTLLNTTTGSLVFDLCVSLYV